VAILCPKECFYTIHLHFVAGNARMRTKEENDNS
jgi:hypothetical protein